MHITVGMPLYKGQDFVAEALQSLQAQTYRDFDVIISVDGDDQISADACRPFLTDTRFRMVIHRERLDWVGNFNWLLQQSTGEFFCYRQHDDLTTPDFFAKLTEAAGSNPDAAIVYADCQFFGEDTQVEATPSIEGDTASRLKQFIQHYAPTACRGIIRREALTQAGLVRVDEFRSNHQIFVWLAKVLRWGNFIRVPEPIYLRRIHQNNYHKQNQQWSNDKKLGDWTTVFTGFLDAVIPICTTVEQHLFFQYFILDRICVLRDDQSYFIAPYTIEQSGAFISRCFSRLEAEGLSILWMLPPTAKKRTERLKRKAARLESQKTASKRRLYTLARRYEALRNSRSIRALRALKRLFRVGR